jgi:hypothetical protein
LDLFVISVLLDAGAGDKWNYVPKDEPGVKYNRSEGLGIASFDLFKSGVLSSDTSQPFQCDSNGLIALTPKVLGDVFQVGPENPLVGLQGRCSLLQRLGSVLNEKPEFFKGIFNRPGNLIHYLLDHETTKKQGDFFEVEIDTLWNVVMIGFSGIWPPTRTKLDGIFLGDVWPCKAMESIAAKTGNTEPGFNLVCFHKLSQWLTYSLMEPLMLANIRFIGVENMTGLAEYRNGGVLVDYGVLKLKPEILEKVPKKSIPTFEVFDDVIVEWRSLTVSLLDEIATMVRKKLNMTQQQLPLAKVLEAGKSSLTIGSWKLGREIAAKLRPDTKSPPIQVISDGTVF